MITEERIEGLLEKCLRFSAADQTEVVVTAEDSFLTRYAANYIHQNTAESNAEVSVRVVLGKKIGVATINSLDDESLSLTVRQAAAIARIRPDLADFRSLPTGEEAGGPAPPMAFAERTARFTPKDRAAAVGRITGLAAKHGFEAAGAFATTVVSLAVANSLGVRRLAAGTRATLTAVVTGSTGSGYADAMSVDADDVDVSGVAEVAVKKCREAQDPVVIEPGDYEVVLEPAAVADMVSHLAYLGLGALAVQEGRSFVSGRLGQRITGHRFTLWDDGQDPSGFPFPFDFEGVLRRKVMLIEEGVARGVVHDSYTAGREPGKVSTGHALPPTARVGPLPVNLFIGTGDSTVEEMVSTTKRGLLVTRFWYTNPVHPVLATLTGMTRDGTFLIESGKVRRPVRNMRFTDSILKALEGIEAISRETALADMWGLGLSGRRP